MAQKIITPGIRQILVWISEQASLTSRYPLKYVGRLADFLAGINLSIRTKILVALCIVILLMGATNIVSMMQVLRYSRQYDAIINNITTANSISGRVKSDIDTEMWKIVAGKVEFSDGQQYEIIDNVDAEVRRMMVSTDSQRARVKLDQILRTLQTLREYVNGMGSQIAQNSTAAENDTRCSPICAQ